MMKIYNPFLLNEVNIRSFLIIIYSVYLAFLGSIGLDLLGISIPFIRQILGFLFLTFIPGIIILRILRIHHLNAARTTVYSVGLSLAVMMFTGFSMNSVYPLLGITRPLSLGYLVFTISGVVVILSVIAYFRDRTYSSLDYLSFHELLSPPVLALSLLPFGAIAGTYLMNFYGINIILMVLLPILAFIPLIITCTRNIPEKFYSYAVFSVALTLLYHSALFSMYLWGWDIQSEYYLTNNVIQNSFLNLNISSSLTAMLSLMILGPIYSFLLKMELIWVFKIIYPFLFALVPLTLYEIIRPQINEKIAFLGCFFFISLFTFYSEMLALARQEIAELFCVLIILSFLDNNLKNVHRSFFFIIFSISMIVSHYGLSYVFCFILLLAWILAVIGNSTGAQNYINRIFVQIRKKSKHFSGLSQQKCEYHLDLLSLNKVLFCILFTFIWYIYTTLSSNFNTLIIILNQIYDSVYNDLLNPKSVQGLSTVLLATVSPLHESSKYLHLLMIFFIVIGFVISVARLTWIRFDSQYLYFSVGALLICVFSMTLPYFASALNTTRMYQISLIFLTPFCIIGGILVFNLVYSYFFPERFSKYPSLSFKVLSILFAVFLLFNSGWFYELFNDSPTSFVLNDSLDDAFFTGQEVFGTLWLANVHGNLPINVDRLRKLVLESVMGQIDYRNLKTISIGNIEGYIFLGHYNIQNNQFSELQRLTNAIYNCGETRIYLPSDN